ncbi:hypothetical protein D3C75_1236470 [compost metagenome]
MLLLRQQLVAVLKYRIPVRTLNLGGQSAFAIKALVLGLVWQFVARQAVKRIVAISTEQGFAWGCHVWTPRKVEGLAPSISNYATSGY